MGDEPVVQFRVRSPESCYCFRFFRLVHFFRRVHNLRYRVDQAVSREMDYAQLDGAGISLRQLGSLLANAAVEGTPLGLLEEARSILVEGLLDDCADVRGEALHFILVYEA